MLKILYILVRGNSFFSLPKLRKFRSKIYQLKFKSKSLVVAEKVIIKPSHPNPDTYIDFGEKVQLDSDVIIDYTAPVQIGNYVTMSAGVNVFTHNHSINDKIDIHYSKLEYSNLIIEDYVWIGTNALVLPSVNRIGKGAIIAAGAVVTKDVNDFEVIAGNPGKVINKRKLNMKSIKYYE